MIAAFALPLGLAAQAPSLAIQVNHPTAKVSPMLYGLMTEEINFSYDGGIYGELVRDRVVGRGFGGLSHWPMVARGNSCRQFRSTRPRARAPLCRAASR